jgi:hypothetical protein
VHPHWIGHDALVPAAPEFWPDLNSGPLRSTDGRNVDLLSLGLPPALRDRLEIRSTLGVGYQVVVTEPMVGEHPPT